MTEASFQTASLLEELASMPVAERAARVQDAGPIDQIVAELGDEAERLVSVDLTRALDATELVVSVSDTLGATFGRARARRARAFALCYAGRFEEALAASHHAIDLAEAAERPLEAARARLGSMQALGELGRLDEAIAAGEGARRSFAAAGEPALAGRADINLGIVHHRKDDPASAVRLFERARGLLGDEPLMLGHIDNSRGEALLALSEFGGAEAAFRSALQAFRQADANLLAAIAEGNLADLAARQGRLQPALHHFECARRYLESDASKGNYARLLAEQAEAMALLGLPQEALSEYQRVLPELDRCGLTMQAARARAGMGDVLLRLNHPGEAETALAAAAMAFSELGNTTARAQVDLVRGDLARMNGRIGEARRTVLSALSVLHDHPVDSATARHLLGRLALDEGDLETAETELAASLNIACKLDLAPLLADVHHSFGELQRRRGRPDQAIDSFRNAVKQVERVRGTFQAQRFRAAFLGNRLSMYEQLVTTLLDSNGDAAITEAFAVAEKAKSRSLVELVGGVVELEATGRSNVEDPTEAKLLRETARMRAELNALYRHVAERSERAGSNRFNPRWQAKVHRHEHRLDELESRLATTCGAASLYAPSISLDQAQGLVAPEAALIEYFTADDEVLAFVIRSDHARTFRHLASPAELADRVRRFQFQINRALRPGVAEGARADRLLEDVQRELGGLHRVLLAPLADELGGCQRLVIVGHGPLHLLPFHALWDSRRYLIESYEVHCAPSATLLSQLAGRTSNKQRNGAPLIVGVADEDAPQITEEVRRVAQVLSNGHGRILLGDEAVADCVCAAAGDASVVHLACHGRFTAASPQSSGLKLADRWLTVRDIFSMRLKADLVTLSACETGLSTIDAGDELVGLVRGFLAAGASAVLVSLWRVDDRLATQMMPKFYKLSYNKGLAGHSKASALRLAQLELLAERPHPAFWAPFTLVGLP